jgi:hypothetical protein
MKRIFTILLASSISIHSISQAFTPGNLAVYRVQGTAALTSAATAVFVDEYTTAGVLVRSIAMPTATSGSNRALTANGTSTTEGMMTRSTDMQYLVLTGYDAAVGAATPSSATSATVNRVIGRIDVAGNVNTTTALSDAYSGSNIRGVASTNGTDFWTTGGNEGVRYATLGSTTSIVVSSTVATGNLTNLRAVHIYDGQLYVSTGSGTNSRVLAVGTGTPTTTGQTMNQIPGLPTAGSPNQFFFADVNPAVPGVDVLYIADDAAATGIQKYSYTGSTWVANGNLVPSVTGTRGLTGVVVGTTVTLYTTNPTNLYSLVDVSGYNANITGTFTPLATAPTNGGFRGVALAPLAAIVPLNLTSFTASLRSGVATLNWTSQNESNVKGFSVEKSLDGRNYSEIAFVNATNRATTTNTYSVADNRVKAGANYYRLKMVDADGSSRYSNAVVLSSKSGIKTELFPNPAVNSLTVSHDKTNAGAVIRILSLEGRQLKTIAVQPGASQTSINVNDLVPGNYLMVFESNGEKSVSKFAKQ